MTLPTHRVGHWPAAAVSLATTMLLASSGASAQCMTFPATTIGAQASGDCKAIGDILGDGRGDPILGGNSLAWYESGASFARWVVRSTPVYQEFSTDMQAADIDDDGDIDLIVGDGGGSGNVLWFQNPRLAPSAGLGNDPRVAANWMFHVIGTHGDWVHDIEVADLDGDGKPEVVTSGHGRTWVWKRSTSGTWSGRNLASMAGVGVFLGDIDGDGRRDIATHQGWIRTPTDLLAGAWTFYPTTGSAGDEVMLADFNGDGRLDAMRCDAHNRGAVYLYLSPANPLLAAWSRSTIDPSMASHHPEPADFDADGRIDFVMGLELQELVIYRNLGGSPPTFAKISLGSSAAHNARVGDLNGDGRTDVFGCDFIGNPPAKVFLQGGSSSVPVVTMQSGSAECPGGTLSLTVAYVPQGTMTFSWRRGATVLSNGATGWGSVIVGATAATLTLQTVTTADAGVYQCIVTDTCGPHASGTNTVSICMADATCDGQISPADIASFVNTWSASIQAGTLTGDYDHSGAVNPADIAAFVNTWFASLLNGC